MPFTLTMPKLSPTMEEGTITKWHKKEGDFVEAGDLLMEVATDKATVEHNAIDEGYLRKFLIGENSDAIVNQPIAIFTETADESIEGYEPEGIKPAPIETTTEEAVEPATQEATASAKPAAKSTTAGTMHQPDFVPLPPQETINFPYDDGSVGGRIKASPVAKKIAEEKGLDLSTVKGTGPGGRIMKKDLERAQPSGDFSFERSSQPSQPSGSYEEVPLDQMRKVISKRLQEAKTFIPHFYVKQSVEVASLVELRTQLRNLDLKVSFNDFVMKACALALRKHPYVNSGFNTQSNAIVLYKTVDISVAVSIDGGLITPIVRYADHKNLGQISQEVRSLAKRAKEGKLSPEEFQGGSFTVSNLGMYGITEFQAIINPPQTSILAVSGINDVPVVKNGAVVPGKIMNITLSADHRVVDGVLGAEFINTVKFYLENPASLLL
ncbi:MAG: pyruvate dehydrogenase complex dihydrolipoamide acetyltransferase [Chlamydiota bacterium]